ncbi:hypothetical protein V8G54_033694 [Vigna mungo]|uniref:Uncharacterized protein n=1 Tax=Vigna mungo TaxID=3915 RepID=A0AAQ3MNR9_VIGMU
MDISATSFRGHQKHTQLEQGKEQRFTRLKEGKEERFIPMKKEVKQDGTKREKLELFFQLMCADCYNAHYVNYDNVHLSYNRESSTQLIVAADYSYIRYAMDAKKARFETNIGRVSR